MFFCFASVSVRPHQATSGSVNTTAGITTFSNALASPSIASTAILCFFERAMREQGAAVDVTDGVDVRVFGLLLGVALNETFVIFGDFGVLKSKIGEIRHAPDADEHAVVKLVARLFVDLRGDFDLLTGGGHLEHFGVEADLLEGFLRDATDRTHQIGIDAGENRGQRFEHDDVAAEGGIDGAELHADIAAADHSRSCGISGSSSASVEVMMRLLPRSKAFGIAGLEPTAMIAFS